MLLSCYNYHYWGAKQRKVSLIMMGGGNSFFPAWKKAKAEGYFFLKMNGLAVSK